MSWRLLLLCCLLLPCLRAAAAEDAARDALRAQAPPWYDVASDDWKRVTAKPPPAPPTLDGGGGISGAFAWVMIGVVVLVSALLLWQLLRNLRLDTSLPVAEQRRVVGARAVADIAALPFATEGTQDPEAALAQALATRDWRRAVAWSYALHLVELDHAGVLRLGKGTTNRGYQRALATWAQAQRGRDELPPLLAQAITTFERTWFGHQPADDALVRELEGGRTRLRGVLGREAGEAT